MCKCSYMSYFLGLYPIVHRVSQRDTILQNIHEAELFLGKRILSKAAFVQVMLSL